jgi:methylmalonyl-CoA/ethylmalonyl-CoA epimerase
LILRIDHVSIAVKDYNRAHDFFKRIMGAVDGAVAEDDNLKYRWQMTSLGDLSRLELITPTGPASFLDGFLSKKDGGVHHITLQVKDIEATRRILDREKIPYFGYAEPSPAWKELFIHPKDAFGVLLQLAEFTPDDWLSPLVKLPPAEKFKVKKDGDAITLAVKNPGGGITELELSRQETQSLINELARNLK